MPDGWRIEERVAPAGQLHRSWPSVDRDPSARRAARCCPTAPAVVLGSTQRPETVDRSAAMASGFDVVRRRSGGGAVLVTPDDPVWIDVWVPAGDVLWTTDVTAAFHWLGNAWDAALRTLGLTGVEVQNPAPGARTRWSSLVCFGAVGAGEVTVDGRKTVGLSQRRNHAGAWFHGACVLHWDASVLLGLLALGDTERAAVSPSLGGAATGVTDAAVAQGLVGVPTAASVAAALLDALP